ncbi:hypothetical protein ACGFS9_14505 [Streptomyces sp. NPDC048566]|uniref:hypothetical protein n=1 Tax=Streptomyces sp. NPDC048566 TaxID=3365569 RepID=UPI0037176BA3
MADRAPGEDGRPDEEAAAASALDELWQRFLHDHEGAIRATAPREPSAAERTAPAPRPARAAGDAAPVPPSPVSVGDLWYPAEPRPRRAWRDLDGVARRRRVGRALGTAAATIVLVGAVTTWPVASGGPAGRAGDTGTQQSEDAPEALPTATALPSAPASAATAAPVARLG